MADEPQKSSGEKGEKGLFKELSGSAVKRLLEPLAATAATAGTAYLMRKSTHIWNESVLPKVREKGGGKAYVKDALEQAADKLPGGRGSGFLQGLAKHLEDASAAPRTTAQPSEQPPSRTGSGAAQGAATDPKREKQRQQRQRRREQRQRELEKTRST